MHERGTAIHVDCPACGVAAETGQASYQPDTDGLHCRSCLFTIVAPGVVSGRGHQMRPEWVQARAGRDGSATDLAAPYRPVSHRRWVLRLVPRELAHAVREPRLGTLEPLALDPSLSSITIRLNRRGGAR